MTHETSGAVSLARELANNPFDDRLVNDPEGIARVLLEHALTEGTTERSMLHMHQLGLHSLMLYDREQTTKPGSDVEGGKIRLFVAEAGAHPLNRFFNPGSDDFNCLPHDHQFPLTIVPVVNSLQHMVTEETPRNHRYNLYKFGFRSAVGTGSFGLKPLGQKHLDTPYYRELVPGDVIQLESNTVHSVTSYEFGTNSTAAWIVIEGPEVEKSSVLYSEEPDLGLDATNLYVPASRSDVERLVSDTLAWQERGY